MNALLGNRFFAALQEGHAVTCPFSCEAPVEWYRKNQVKKVPEHIRGVVALLGNMRTESPYRVGEEGFDDYVTYKSFVEILVCGAIGAPPHTNIGFYAEWDMVVVLPQDQSVCTVRRAAAAVAASFSFLFKLFDSQSNESKRFIAWIFS